MGLGGFGGCVRLGKEGGVGWGDCLIFIYVCVCVCASIRPYSHTRQLIDACMHVHPNHNASTTTPKTNNTHHTYTERERRDAQEAASLASSAGASSSRFTATMSPVWMLRAW